VVVYRLGQAEIYGVCQNISLSQSPLDHTLEALRDLFAAALLFQRQGLWQRLVQFSPYCDGDMKTQPREISLLLLGKIEPNRH
jgi:hypothetical protein